MSAFLRAREKEQWRLGCRRLNNLLHHGPALGKDVRFMQRFGVSKP